MNDYKVSLTAEDEAKIKEVAQTFIQNNTAEALKEMGATEEYVLEMLRLYTMQAKMYYAIIEETDREVKDEDANMRGYSYIKIALDGKYDDKGKFVKYTDAEVLKIETDAKKMENELEESSLEDVAKKYGYKVETGSYATKAAADILGEKTLYNKLEKLKQGETSEMLEFDKAIYFIRIDNDTDEKATKEKREAIIKERETKLYNDKITEWQKNDSWKANDKVIAKIDFHHIFTQDDGSTEKDTSKNTEKNTEKGTETSTEKGTEKTTEK
jgi:foldase protein PrsA